MVAASSPRLLFWQMSSAPHERHVGARRVGNQDMPLRQERLYAYERAGAQHAGQRHIEYFCMASHYILKASPPVAPMAHEQRRADSH